MAGSFGLSEKMDAAETKCMSCGAPLPAGREEQQKFTGGLTIISVLGEDDEKTDRLVMNVTTALMNVQRKAMVEKIIDKAVIESYHVRLLPALIINGSIVSQGIISEVEDIEGELNYIL